jgi:hypothetical protein
VIPDNPVGEFIAFSNLRKQKAETFAVVALSTPLDASGNHNVFYRVSCGQYLSRILPVLYSSANNAFLANANLSSFSLPTTG